MIRKSSLLLLLFVSISGFSQDIDLLILNRDYQQALNQIDQKLDQNPSPDLYYKKSLVHKQLMDYPAALYYLSQALEMDSTSVNYLSERANLYQAMGNHSKAVLDFQKALLLQPGDLLLKYELGRAFLMLNDYKNAFQTFEEIQAVDSTNVMFNKYSALAAYKAKRNKRAIQLYEKYLLQNPDDLSAYINISNAYDKLKQPNKSMTFLFMAQRRFPDNEALHLKLANHQFVNKNYQFAQRSYHQYMQKYDTLLPVLLNYGICLYHNKQTQDALEILEMCYTENPNDVYVNFYLGICHKRLKDYEFAAKFLDFAIYISVPDFHPEMYHHLAQVYAKQKAYEKSIECYEKAYELNSDKVEVLFEIASTYEKHISNKTLALNYYQIYLKEAGEQAENAYFALDRIKKIKEELFFEK